MSWNVEGLGMLGEEEMEFIEVFIVGRLTVYCRSDGNDLMSIHLGRCPYIVLILRFLRSLVYQLHSECNLFAAQRYIGIQVCVYCVLS